MQPSDKYGKRYDRLVEKRLLPRIISMIDEQVRQINEAGNQSYIVSQKAAIRDQFLKEVADVQAAAVKGGYREGVTKSNKLHTKAGVTQVLTSENIELMLAVKATGFQELAAQALMDVNNIWRELARYSITGNYSALQKTVFDKLDDLRVAKHGKTIVDTSIDTFYRQTNAIRSISAGVTKYRYMGPSPERDFCRELFASGRVYTIEEINKMDNGQIGDVFTSAGGYNCRHYWSPVL